MSDPVRVGPWVTGYRGYWYRMFPDQLIACCVAQYGWNVTGPMSIFTGEIIASGPEDGDEGKRRADAAAEAQGWTLERDPATEPRQSGVTMNEPVHVGPWRIGYLGHWYREFPDYLFACRVGTDGWVVVGPMAIFHGEIIASGPEDGDEGKRRADAAAEAQGWILDRNPETEPREVPRIVMDPARMTGEPTIGESRLTVRTVLGLITQGYSDAQILDHYDYLTQEGIDAARAWWASPEGMAWALDKIAALLDKEEE